MDTHTLELLEFGKILDLLASYAATPLGKELARQLRPGQSVAALRLAVRHVTEMTEVLDAGQGPSFGGLTDVRLLVRRAGIGSALSASELLEVREALACTGHIYRWRMRLDSRWHGLIDLLARLEDLGPVAKIIEGCIDPRGSVLDMASPELSSVRGRLRDLEEQAKNEIRRLLRDPKLREALRYDNATVCGDHLVLPVAVNHRHRIAGVVHRTSSTGDTVFIEPASIARLSAERSLLKVEEEREVNKILRRLTAEVARVAKPLQMGLDLLAQLDLIHAKARYSIDYGMTPPDFADDGRLWLRDARHPLLEHLFRHGLHQSRKPGPPAANGEAPQVVPIEVRLGFQFDLLVITGPNTGGKTVALKTTGLLCLLALSGMHIPAGLGSVVPVLGQILADIGDEQSLEQSLSTFSSHISRIATILKQADRSSLVLLDELGAGTDPSEGAALGRAILDELRKSGCRAMVTTHLGDLKTYAFHHERVENAAVAFDVQSMRPTYKLEIGHVGRSCALQIAKRFDLPRDLVKRAHHYLRKRQGRGGELRRLQQARLEAEKARSEALRAELAARQQEAALAEQQAELARARAVAAQLEKFRESLLPGAVVRLERLDQPGRIVRVDRVKGIAVVKAGIGQWEVPVAEVFPPSAG